MNIAKIVKPFILLFMLSSCSGLTEYDIIIKNGTIYDGSGGTPFPSDIGIINERILKVADLSGSKAARVIDAKGLSIAPGFIDMHSHLDPILNLPECESLIRQGVTTALGGPDGSSPWPFAEYLDTLDHIGVGMNVAYLIGHNQVRKNVMGLDNREPNESELEQMKAQIEQAMKEGAYGISTGLKYLPGAFSKTSEIIELSKIAADYEGIYTSHLREEGLGLIEGVQEAIFISREADIPVVLTHHKVVGKPMWGKSVKTLAMVDSARALGLDIKIDQYPYAASYTGISILIPSWARAGGKKSFAKRIENPVLRDSIRSGIVFNIVNDRGGNDLSRVQFAKVKWNRELEGKTLKYWSEQKDLEPTIENGADLVIEAQLNGGASCVFFAMDEKDVERIMSHPLTMIGSDARLVKPGIGHPHPRYYGTYPRILGYYVREKAVITLSQAINKMTLLPAQTLGIRDRGMIKENTIADIVIFDASTVIDRATFEDPHQYPEGISYVLIGGKLVVNKGEFSDIRGGRVLRKQ